MFNNTDRYMELFVFLVLWGFGSSLASREKHPAHCTIKTILVSPEKAADQILCFQGNLILSLFPDSVVDISVLNIFSSKLVMQKFLPAELLRELFYPYHSTGAAVK